MSLTTKAAGGVLLPEVHRVLSSLVSRSQTLTALRESLATQDYVFSIPGQTANVSRFQFKGRTSQGPGYETTSQLVAALQGTSGLSLVWDRDLAACDQKRLYCMDVFCFYTTDWSWTRSMVHTYIRHIRTYIQTNIQTKPSFRPAMERISLVPCFSHTYIKWGESWDLLTLTDDVVDQIYCKTCPTQVSSHSTGKSTLEA